MFPIDWFIKKIYPVIILYLRPFIKWFLHTFTRLSELQRICYGAQAGASRARQVERSLTLSKNAQIICLIGELNEKVQYCNDEELRRFVPYAVSIVQTAKHIKTKCHPDFGNLFGTCIIQIWSYRQLMHIVERLRSEAFDSDNIEHEQKLMELWQCLMPKEPLVGRITKQWQDIGFQGDDPKTDFRGMGLLGLENLLYFAREYNDAAKHVLLHSMHPKFGYTFAIVGINLTSMAYRLLKSGYAKTHFYNVAHNTKQPCTLTMFHRFYCYLFFEFDRFWVESEPKNIMDFSEIHRNFEITIIEALQNDSTVFKTNLVIEGV